MLLLEGCGICILTDCVTLYTGHIILRMQIYALNLVWVFPPMPGIYFHKQKLNLIAGNSWVGAFQKQNDRKLREINLLREICFAFHLRILKWQSYLKLCFAVSENFAVLPFFMLCLVMVIQANRMTLILLLLPRFLFFCSIGVQEEKLLGNGRM